jgi:hypothetical protein
VAGAALFSALHPAPRDAYEAAGTIVIPAGREAPQVEVRTRQAAELLRQPNVVGEALERALQASEPERALRGLSVEPRPDAGVVRFSVRAATAATATRLAEELGRVAVQALQRGHATGERFGLRVAGDFEVDLNGWGPTGQDEGLARVGLVPGGRYGGGALRFLCEAAEGCGVARVIEGRFPAGRPVSLSAWVRGRRPSNVLLALGSADRNDRELREAFVDESWRRLAVSWTPREAESRISLAVANAGPGLADADVDGVILVDEGAPLTEAAERRLFAERGFAYATGVRIVSSRTGSTLSWAAIGAVVGLLVGLAGVLGWTLARGRARRLSV